MDNYSLQRLVSGNRLIVIYPIQGIYLMIHLTTMTVQLLQGLTIDTNVKEIENGRFSHGRFSIFY